MDFFLLFLIISQTGFSYFLFTKIKQLQKEKEYQSTWSSYIKSKEKIENCLTTLKRDRQLKKLFDKDLDDSK